MHSILLALLTFFVFIFEGTVMQILIPEQIGDNIVLIPRFTMIIVGFIAIYLTPGRGIVYGLIFGLLYDIIFTNLIGVYTFSIAFVAYVLVFIARFFHGNLFITLVVSLIGVSMLEFLVYGLFTLIGLIDVQIDIFAYQRLFPSLLLNGAFVLIVYFPLKKWLLQYILIEQENN
jgi:rod shape-determining protein MreD